MTPARRAFLGFAVLAFLGGISLIDRTVDADAGLVPVAPYADGAVLMDMIRVESAGADTEQPGLLTAEEALDRASAAAGHLADRGNPHSMQLAYVTNDAYGPTDENGVLLMKAIDHRLSWLVRFTGTPQPVYGGRLPNGKPMAEGEPVATELNVVIDAISGEVLMMFSFQ